MAATLVKTKKRCCTPTCEAASPAPFASYIVSYIASTNFTSVPSMSVTGAVGRLSTGSPKSRIVWVGIRPCYRRPAEVRFSKDIEAEWRDETGVDRFRRAGRRRGIGPRRNCLVDHRFDKTAQRSD
jgi:hypothetical protein